MTLANDQMLWFMDDMFAQLSSYTSALNESDYLTHDPNNMIWDLTTLPSLECTHKPRVVECIF